MNPATRRPSTTPHLGLVAPERATSLPILRAVVTTVLLGTCIALALLWTAWPPGAPRG